MDYGSAIAKMQQGEKIKLPEWTGYWFSSTPAGEVPIIKVLTKSGDILDTPWIDKYIMRDDWEIADGKLGFDFAILALENGKSVRRRGWATPSWLTQQMTDARSKMSRPYMYMSIPSGSTIQFPPTESVDGERAIDMVPWTPSQTDMFAKDWVLVPNRPGRMFMYEDLLAQAKEKYPELSSRDGIGKILEEFNQ